MLQYTIKTRTQLLLVAFVVWWLPVVAWAGGTIEGTVVYTGKAGRNPPIRMASDPHCARMHDGEQVTQELVALQADGSVDNVFVHLLGNVPYAGGPPTAPVLVEQEGCIYQPRVSGAMTGQTLTVRNNDATLHNVRTESDAGNSFNVGQPKAGMEHAHTLRGTEVMLRLRCDLHPWMVGYVGVKSHPYFAVTANGGTFIIENVPAGTYTVQAWQERLGAFDQTVEVKDGETTTVTFSIAAPQKKAQIGTSLPVTILDLRQARTDR